LFHSRTRYLVPCLAESYWCGIRPTRLRWVLQLQSRS
jgi:hypothetical protein